MEYTQFSAVQALVSFITALYGFFFFFANGTLWLLLLKTKFGTLQFKAQLSLSLVLDFVATH